MSLLSSHHHHHHHHHHHPVMTPPVRGVGSDLDGLAAMPPVIPSQAVGRPAWGWNHWYAQARRRAGS
jgi:hypothetical protein